MESCSVECLAAVWRPPADCSTSLTDAGWFEQFVDSAVIAVVLDLAVVGLAVVGLAVVGVAVVADADVIVAAGVAASLEAFAAAVTAGRRAEAIAKSDSCMADPLADRLLGSV